ncbi:MAG: homoserine kinase [Bacteroidales bacterium]|nr:homoserine kinase [Bacteroidales bacterium]
MKTVRVFAPASIANMGCGFDVMGFALDDVGDILEMTLSDGDGITIVNNTDVPLPEDIEDNVITPVIRKFFSLTGLSGHIDVAVCRKIFPGSGIGSSAASSAAAAFGMNELFGRPLSGEELVVCAMEGENLASGGYHADNAAPALLGGIILIRGYEPLDLVSLPVPDGFFCTVVHPAIVVSTKAARGVLPKAVPMHDAVCQWGNVGGLVAGLFKGDMGLVGRAMKDSVAEPYRKHFIPGFDDLREKVLGAGAIAMNISGSGPSVFALSSELEVARRAGSVMREHFGERDFKCDIYVTKVAACGARLLER